MRISKKIISSRCGNLGILTLNNPKAYHALTIDMIHHMHDLFEEWKQDGTLNAILIKSSHGETRRPVFCAGGDVKAVCATKDPQFFFDEYQVNHSIATSSIPIISIWDGIVMGGGVGISIHGKYRIATEHTIFAMPETKIGLFPDVGSMFWMPRLLSKPMAIYLALTGKQIRTADLLQLNLATHYVKSEDLPELERSLTEASNSCDHKDRDLLEKVLLSFHQLPDTEDSYLAQHKDFIDQTFNANSVEEILVNLDHQTIMSSDFVQETKATLHHVSPTSLKLTLEGLRRGAECSTIAEDLQMEYRMANACTTRENSDFHEGVRAVLIDKEKGRPNWNPNRLDEVTRDMINEFFVPVEKDLVFKELESSVMFNTSSSKL